MCGPRQAPAAWGAQLNYGPADRDLTSLRELKNLLGMGPELYDRLAPVVTLHSRQRGFDPDLAPQALLALLSNPGDGEGELLPDFQRYQSRSRRRSFRLTATVSPQHSHEKAVWIVSLNNRNWSIEARNAR